MASTPDPGRRKTRTREHIIADLGVNFVERQILLAGYTAERFLHDYGTDLMVKTYTPAGEVEAGQFGVQVKATDHFAAHADGHTFPLRVAVADLRQWVLEWPPFVLAVYDAAGDRAFWLDAHEYVRRTGIDEDAGGSTATLRVPVVNVLDVAAVLECRDRKERGG